MTISTLDQWIASRKQLIRWMRITFRATVALRWFAIHDLSGMPGTAALSAGNSVNGTVPTDATVGFPPITFTSGTGYLSSVSYGSDIACRLMLYDRLFAAGPFSFNSAVTLTSQPSYASRVPSSDFTGLQVWLEQVTASTGTQSVAVTYTNHAGAAGRTTGTTSVGAAFTVGSMFQLPLQAGDVGVQKIESVTGSVATAGTFNIVVARPLWTGRVIAANSANSHSFAQTGMPHVFPDSALCVMCNSGGSTSGAPDVQLTVVSA